MQYTVAKVAAEARSSRPWWSRSSSEDSRTQAVELLASIHYRLVRIGRFVVKSVSTWPGDWQQAGHTNDARFCHPMVW